MAPGRLGGWRLLAAAIVAGLASGCSSDKPAVSAAQERSEQTLKKDCNDQKWREQNLGLWYSLCRQPLKW